MSSCQLFKRWIAVSTGQIWLYPVDNAIGCSEIYLLHSAIQRLKNQGLDSRPRLGIRTNSIETTSFQVRWEFRAIFK